MTRSARIASGCLFAAALLAGAGCSKEKSRGAGAAPAPPPPLSITGLAPVSGPTTGGTLVTITGTSFAAGATVTFAGSLATTVTVVSGGTITCFTPAGAAGPATVVVTNPGPASATAVNAFTYLSGPPPAPTITGLNPTFGPVAGGTLVTMTGTGFQTGATVTVGGSAATSVTVLTAGTITFVTPAGASGPASVTVTNPGPSSATATNAYTYVSGAAPAPTISSISPASGPTAGGTTITITGTGFQRNGASQATVTIAGSAATSVQVLTATTIVCVTPAGPAGAQNVVVTNPDAQSATAAGGFTYIGPSPTVTSLNPTSGTVLGGTTVTITGTNFASGATVLFGSNLATVSTVTATQIVVISPAGSAIGPTTVTVTNPGGGSGSLTNGYNYLGSPPTITGINPATGASTGGTTVTITGTNFYPGATVTFGSVVATPSSITSTQIVVTTPSVSPALGPTNVTVTNTDGQSVTSAGGFNFLGPAPGFTSVTPTTGPNTGGTTVTISGTNFFAGATVTIGGAAATVSTISSTQIVATTGSVAPSVGPSNVVVTNVDGQSATGTGVFTYTGPSPTVTSVSPNVGPTFGGQTVTVTGTNFVSGATVTFGGNLATSVTVVNSTTITCVTPAGTGSVNVVVTNADGNFGTGIGAYSYTTVGVGSVSPSGGPPAGGTFVTITGWGFAAGATVTFGGSAATSVTVVSSTSITAVTPSGTVGTSVTVTVTNTDTSTGSLANGFTYNNPPSLTSVSPASGPETGGTLITLTGTFFASGATVTVGGTAATSVTFVSSTTLTAVTPAGTAGAVAVTVTNPDTQSSTLASGFTYLRVRTWVVTSQTDWAQQDLNGVDLLISPGDVVLRRRFAGYFSCAYRVAAVAYHNVGNTPQRFLAGTSNAGAFLTTNNGTSWTPFNLYTTPALPSNRVTAVAYYSGDTTGNTFLIGTDAGAVLTRDGGQTFRLFDAFSSPALPDSFVTAVAFADGAPNAQVFAICVVGGFTTSPAGCCITRNGGATFTVFNSNSTPSVNSNVVSAVAFWPGDTAGNSFLIGCYDFGATAPGGAYYTTNGGASFTAFSTASVPAIPSNFVTGVAFHQGGTSASSWLVTMDRGGTAANSGGIIRTTNSGGGFTTWWAGLDASSPTWNSDVNRIAFAYSPGLFNPGPTATVGGFLFTTNAAGAATWTQVLWTTATPTPGPLLDPGVRGVEWFRGSTNTSSILVGSGRKLATGVSGGLQQTLNTTTTFTTFSLPNPHNFATDDVRSVSILNDGTGQRILVGTAAGAYRTADGGSTWTRFTTASGLPSNDVRSVAYFQGNTAGLVFLVGTTAGAARTTDGGSSWATYTTQLPGTDVRSVSYHSGVASNSGVFLVGTTAGLAWTTNGGSLWTQRTTGTTPALPSNDVRSVAWYDGDTGFGTFLAATALGAVLTTNSGTGFTTYTNLAGQLPSDDCSSVAFANGVAGGTTYLIGTNLGAVLTTNSGTSFTTFSATSTPALPSSDVDAVAFFHGNTTGANFAIGCATLAVAPNTPGGFAMTSDGGATFTTLQFGTSASLPRDDVSAVDYDDSVATADRIVIGIPSPFTGSSGGVLVLNGPANVASGVVTVMPVDGRLINGTGPLIPSLPDREVLTVSYFLGNTLGSRILVGGTWGAAFTTDGGLTWTTWTSATTPALPSDVVNSVAMFSGDTLGQTFLIGTNAGALLTTNGGSSFTTFTTTNGLASNVVTAVSFHDTTAAGARFIVGTIGGAVLTTNGGTSFGPLASITPAMGTNISSVDFFDADTTGNTFLIGVFAGGGGGGGCFRTTNGGTNFAVFNLGNPANVPSSLCTAVSYCNGDFNGNTFLFATNPPAGQSAGGVCVTTNAGTTFAVFSAGSTPAIPESYNPAAVYYQGSNGLDFLAGTQTRGAAVTASAGAAFTTRDVASGSLLDDRVTWADFGGGSNQQFAIATLGGIRITVNGGTSFVSPSPGTLSRYDKLIVTQATPAGTSILYRVTDRNGVLIPDSALPGNSAGFTPNASNEVPLGGLSVASYPSIRVRATLATTIPASTPTLSEIRVVYIY
ncbi:MAG: IPT/TIG domain-containing protein [Planctomycetales bacterium]|nr:IPT/TIG domain-containing protein [Planctomycetales bacterium]